MADTIAQLNKRFGPPPTVNSVGTLTSNINARTDASEGSAASSRMSVAERRERLPFVAKEAKARMQSAISQSDINANKAIKARVEARAIPMMAARQATEAADAIDRILGNEAFPEIVGRNINLAYGMVGHRSDSEDTDMAGMPRLLWGNTKAADLVADLKRLQSMAYIQGRKQMTGQGSIQAGEALRALGSVASLDPNQNPVTYAKQAIDLRNRLRASANAIGGVYAEEKARAVKQGNLSPDDATGFRVLSRKPFKQ